MCNIRKKLPYVLSGAAVTVFLLCALVTARAGDETLPVVCPAIAAEDSEPIWGGNEDPGPVELVVEGMIQSLGKDPTLYDNPWSLDVKKCIYGDSSIKAIPRITAPYSYARPSGSGRGIFSLSRREGWQDSGWVFRHTYPTEEGRWQAALATARFEFDVFSSTYVFVGRWQGMASRDQKRQHEPGSNGGGRPPGVDDRSAEALSVVRSIHGPSLKAGVQLGLTQDPRSDRSSVHRLGEAIYAVARVKVDLERRRQADELIGEASYRLMACWPLARETEVKDALARRGDLPIVEGQRNRVCFRDENEHLPWDPVGALRSGPRCREVILRGPIDEAVAMLASESVGVRVLAVRTLVIRRDEAKPKLLVLVADKLLMEREAIAGQFRQLHEAIRVLAQIGEAAPGGALRQGVEKILVHVEARRTAEAAPSPPLGRRHSMWDRRIDAESITKSPHALLWIVERLSQEDAVKQYGRRMLALRPYAPQPWRDALQEALTSQRIEESLELTAGWHVMREVQPARSHLLPWCVDRSNEIVFSADSRTMVVASTFGQAAIWDTADWNIRRFLSYQNRYPHFDLAPAGDSLRVVFHDSVTAFPVLRDQSARITRLPGTPEMYATGITADGRLVVGERSHEDAIDIWDTATGRLVRSIVTPQYRSAFVLAPQAGLIARHSTNGFVVERLLATSKKRPLVSSDGEVVSMAFSPDERMLLTVSDSEANPIVRAWNVADGKLLATRSCRHRTAAIRFSPSGMTVALIHAGESDELGVYRVSDLRLLGTRSFTKSESSYHDQTVAAFSADDRWLCLAVTGKGVWIHALPAMTESKSFPIADPLYHSQENPGAAFSPDGKWLVVVGADRVAPRWFRTADWTEVEPYAGHGGQVTGLHFVDGGKALVSWSADGTICRWDAETMAMQSRRRAPAGYRPLRMLGRSDQLMVCAKAAEVPRELKLRHIYPDHVPEAEAEPRQIQRIFNLLKQQFVGELHVPATGEVVWVNDDEYLWGTDGGRWRRVRARDGRVLESRKMAPLPGRPGRGSAQYDASEDGAQLWSLSGLRGDPRGLQKLTLRIYDAAALKVTREMALDRRHWSNEPFALVPGGKFFSIGPQIFDRTTCRFLHDREYLGMRYEGMAFSPDGSRFAAVSFDRMYVEGGPRDWSVEEYGFIHVHDTASGRLIAMIPSSSRWGRVWPLCFSEDGRQLALSGVEGVIAVWKLPR